TSVSVIPAHAGIQAVFVFGPRANLDAGLRRHDKSSLRLNTIPEGDIKHAPSVRIEKDLSLRSK
ncbi:MAG: hypothetical protein ACTHLX_02185, partial [Candidatus Binatia bacterium]